MKVLRNWSQDDQGQWWYKDAGRAGRYRGVIRVCQECGEEFPNIKSRRHGGGIFCGRTCAGRHKNPVGLPAERSIHWRGGRIIRRGYALIYAPDHPSIAGRGTKRKYVLEHRLVMEKELGRLLLPNEEVHHKNGVKDDNPPENLELWVRSQPAGVRSDGRHCPTCTCFKEIEHGDARFRVDHG